MSMKPLRIRDLQQEDPRLRDIRRCDAGHPGAGGAQRLADDPAAHHLPQRSGRPAPEGHKKIRVHFVFDVKHDGRHKARLVAGGHLTDVPLESVYSGVVTLRGFRFIVFMGELYEYELWATDIGNAYLESFTREKVYIIAGPEFKDRQGHILIIKKALYGIRTSGKMWNERLA